MLLKKVWNTEIRGMIYKWIGFYLSRRMQFVRSCGANSFQFESLPVIPQGSNLCPLLFLIFINDLEGLVDCKMMRFADDVKLFFVVSSESNSDLL